MRESNTAAADSPVAVPSACEEGIHSCGNADNRTVFSLALKWKPGIIVFVLIIVVKILHLKEPGFLKGERFLKSKVLPDVLCFTAHMAYNLLEKMKNKRCFIFLLATWRADNSEICGRKVL